MAASNPIEKFDSLLQQSKFIFAVYYRGHWCPFCMGYLTTFASLTQSIEAAGGVSLIITAEDASHLDAVRDRTGYTREALNDPDQLLAEELKSRGLLDVAITKKSGYPHGLAQPAVLVMRPDGSVLQQWAIVPSTMNLGGAKDRPVLEQIWENVQKQLEGKEVVHKEYATTGILILLGSKFGLW
ncbi:hypothetical protein FMEXI_7808 [Fusarium mexicanum]|uniref:Alkyl hydroperoxide reductase subunit C/ Thiol specific antioxidant domain-containing protein n=1 Tax=Fusarium mexicanum TaxID=751941 RepID=A0A8H5ITM0_9HYPO|nr:hypothetical protein FMEXI_7808 [Fusarium mexicanum]